jgi:aspartate kinase
MLIVKKFGGTSLANPERIKHVIKIIRKFFERGDLIVLVVSAPSGMTDKILDDIKNFEASFDLEANLKKNQSVQREIDQALICGESLNAALVSCALNYSGMKSRSFNAFNLPIFGSEKFFDSDIVEINKEKIFNFLKNGFIPVITGFQAVNFEKEDCMSLGRGGSDYTAVMVSAALNADECYIYTDVDGVFETDPNIVKNAKKIKNLSFDEAVLISEAGAKILQDKSALAARKYNVNLKILSSFLNENEIDDDSGTSVLSASFLNRNNEFHNDFVAISYKMIEKSLKNLYEITIIPIQKKEAEFNYDQFLAKLSNFLEIDGEKIILNNFDKNIKIYFRIQKTKKDFDELLNNLYNFCQTNLNLINFNNLD